MIVYVDLQSDLALVRVLMDEGARVPYLELGDSAAVTLGYSVIGLGYETSATPHRAAVSQLFDTKYYGTFRVDFRSVEGDSGGPVVDDETGQVVGVIRAGIPGQTVTYVTQINLAANLVQVIGAPPATALESPKMVRNCESHEGGWGGWFDVSATCLPGSQLAFGGCTFSDWVQQPGTNAPLEDGRGWHCTSHGYVSHSVEICAVAYCLRR
jgi:hypothetical protein